MVTFVSILDLIYVDNIYLHNFETKEFHQASSPMPIRCEFQYTFNEILYYIFSMLSLVIILRSDWIKLNSVSLDIIYF